MSDLDNTDHRGSDPISPTRPAASRAMCAPDDAAAEVLRRALGEPSMTTAAALSAHRQRLAALQDPTTPDSLQELSRSLPVLEALFQRFAADAMRQRRPADRALLLRVAILAQQAHARTFTLIRGLVLQDKDRAAVVLNAHNGSDGFGG